MQVLKIFDDLFCLVYPYKINRTDASVLPWIGWTDSEILWGEIIYSWLHNFESGKIGKLIWFEKFDNNEILIGAGDKLPYDLNLKEAIICYRGR